MISTQIVVKINDVLNENESIRIFFCELKNNFYEDLKIESCMLKKNKLIYLINAMIDSDCFDYLFINKIIVREICEALNINLVRLIKSKMIKKYDDQSRNAITHVLFFHLTVQDHIENLTSMMIVHLSQQDLILNKSGLRRHAVDYHEINDTIFFKFGHCTHYDASDYSFLEEKVVMLPVASSVVFTLIMQSTKILKRDESQPGLSELRKIETKLSIVMQKNKIYKKTKRLINQKLIKKNIGLTNLEKKKVINIVMIDAVLFDLLIRDKEIEIFAIFLQDVNYELKKKSKKIINSKNIVFEKYHDFLNVFFKKKVDILFLHRKYDHKIELLKKKSLLMHFFIACQKANCK